MKTVMLIGLMVMLAITGRLQAKDESFLIRRAYIDTIGIVPTIEEIEWYCTYNTTNSYEAAVHYLINNPKCKLNVPKRLLKMLLMSSEYKAQDKIPMLREQVIKNLFYVVGMGNVLDYSDNNYKIACYKLIDNALNYGDDPADSIDYMANCLMSRTTHLSEINGLIRIVKDSNKPEREALFDVLNVLLTFEDVINY